MKEIRVHGRGGQGSVTAAELLAIAAFSDGKFSQAFPSFGVERRGAPVQAFTRIGDKPIRLRSQIYEPDYVIVQDPTLIDIVDVAHGMDENGIVIINSDFNPEDFNIKTEKDDKTKVNVIKAFKDQIISIKETETLDVKNNLIEPNLDKDILKVAVVERYGKTEPSIGKGFVKGFGLKEGAIAISVTPDVHHMIVVGVENEDLSKAINRLVELEGGIVIAKNGKIVDELPLPIGGLVSQEPYEKVGEKLKKIRDKTHELGCVLPSPFMTLAFVGCPTLTEFKITDKGLVDVVNYELVSLEPEE